jgi:hypothetical protein
MSRVGSLHLFAAAVMLVVAATLVTALFVLGTPTEQRQLRLDERRVADLIDIKTAITAYVVQHGSLPPDLAALEDRPGRRIRKSDPETGAAYEYSPVSGLSYRLCAVFARRSEGNGAPAAYFNEGGWEHEAGHQCFNLAESLKE